uniref:hypothetical protein n=1 Tax=Clostridium butyricum TaxID=1492 RepID=UPI00374E34F1
AAVIKLDEPPNTHAPSLNAEVEAIAGSLKCLVNNVLLYWESMCVIIFSVQVYDCTKYCN